MSFPMDPKHPDRGFLYERVHFDPLEAAFASDWEKYNQPRPGLNYGMSALQGILSDRNGNGLEVTRRDRFVAASVIQWLGTNCGYSFLQTALAKVGYGVTNGWTFRSDDADTALSEAIRMAESEAQTWQMIFDLSEPH